MPPQEKSDCGSVEITRSGTVQVKQYHPVSVSVSLRLPLREGETPQEAIGRVDEIVNEAFDHRMLDIAEGGWQWERGKRKEGLKVL